MIRIGAVFILCAFLAACQTAQPVADPRGVWCDTNKPLPKLPGIAVASLSRSDKERLIAYELKGEAWCGWKP